MEHIKRQMEELDERKNEMSDGDYLKESNRLLENYRQIKKDSSSSLENNIITVQRATLVRIYSSSTRMESIYRLIDNEYVLTSRRIG